MLTSALIQFDNSVNPILLRELRQLVRNRFVVVMLILYVSVLALVSTLTVLFSGYADENTIGSSLYLGMSGIMIFATTVIVTSYTALTTANERINADLMYISTVSPTKIIWGKFYSGVLLSLMLFSATLPFLTLAYLLRGIDVLPAILGIFVAYLVIQCGNALVIYTFASLKTHTQLIFVGGCGFFLVMYLSSAATMIPYGISYSHSRTPVWDTVGLTTLASVCFVFVILTAATVIVAPPSSNRMLPMRIVLSLWYLLSFGFVLLFPNWIPNIHLMCISLNAFLFCVLLVVAFCERDTHGPRIKLSIPKNLFLRICAFPFFTGAVNSLAWLCLIGVGMFLAIMCSMQMLGGTISFDNVFGVYMTALLFIYAHGMTALMFRIKFFPKKIPPEKTVVMFFALAPILSLGSLLIYFLIFAKEWNADFLFAYQASVFSAINPFMLVYNWDGEYGQQTVCAAIWSALITIVAFPWIVAQIRSFRPCS